MLSGSIRIAAIVLAATISLSMPADAKKGGGGGGGGGHGGGKHMSAPRGGGHAGGMRAHAGRSFAAPRAHIARAPRAHVARAIRHGRPAITGRSMRGHFAARSVRHSAMERRAARAAVMRAQQSSRAAARAALRSAPVHARGDFRTRGDVRNSAANAFARRAFSGRDAQALAGRAFQGPNAFSRHRFDPAWLGRSRFAGAFWPGPYFWPYAYYDETFWLWPSAYDRMFWAYGYDDILDGIYRPYAFADEGERRPRRGARASPVPGGFAQLCGAPAPGLTEWPIEEIAAAVQPAPPQQAALAELKRAADAAAEVLRAACPRDVPATPLGRLEVMQQQFAAIVEAAQLVNPALEKFYGALSDEQKERFNALGPGSSPARQRARATPSDQLAQACREGSPDLAASRLDRIADAVRPDDAQRAAFEKLRAAMTEAAKTVAAACPNEMPLTPTGRLAEMERRASAMLEAVKTMRPALATFYAVLNDEQKAHFNRALAENTRRAG